MTRSAMAKTNGMLDAVCTARSQAQARAAGRVSGEAVSGQHACFGYDMKLGSGGVWYATGIFGDKR